MVHELVLDILAFVIFVCALGAGIALFFVLLSGALALFGAGGTALVLAALAVFAVINGEAE